VSNRIITLIRHGKVDGPTALYGHTDIPSSVDGIRELQNNIGHIHSKNPISHIVSSPLIRCAVPAREFSHTNHLPLHIADGLKEMHFGHWDGIPFEQFSDEYWQSLNRFWDTPASAHAPDGESLKEFAERVIHSWKNLEEKSAQHQLVICHGGVIRIIIAHLLNLDWTNASLFRQLHIDYASHTQIEIAIHQNALPIVKYIGQNNF
jgi:alpha-ribazole phosphatase